jgi:hypothetical protein
VNIDGYTPVCVTGVWSNHAGSCCITQFALRDNKNAVATVKNLEIIHHGTWTDLKLSITVLYRKSSA